MKPVGIVYIFKEPVLTHDQFARLSNIFDNAGQIFLAGAVLNPIINGIDNTEWFIVALGLALTGGLWILSLYFAKKQ